MRDVREGADVVCPPLGCGGEIGEDGLMSDQRTDRDGVWQLQSCSGTSVRYTSCCCCGACAAAVDDMTTGNSERLTQGREDSAQLQVKPA